MVGLNQCFPGPPLGSRHDRSALSCNDRINFRCGICRLALACFVALDASETTWKTNRMVTCWVHIRWGFVYSFWHVVVFGFDAASWVGVLTLIEGRGRA